VGAARNVEFFKTDIKTAAGALLASKPASRLTEALSPRQVLPDGQSAPVKGPIDGGRGSGILAGDDRRALAV